MTPPATLESKNTILCSIRENNYFQIANEVGRLKEMAKTIAFLPDNYEQLYTQCAFDKLEI